MAGAGVRERCFVLNVPSFGVAQGDPGQDPLLEMGMLRVWPTRSVSPDSRLVARSTERLTL